MNVEQVESNVLTGLKDFQIETVGRVVELFNSGQSRVTVADEVGLGKTLIAKGVIAKFMKQAYEQGRSSFKVIYICSNLHIAGQNIKKLKICKEVHVENDSDTRLSMQHIKAYSTGKVDNKDFQMQITPLTPQTSFNMKSSLGTKAERALIWAVLVKCTTFEKQWLKRLLVGNVTSLWDETCKEYLNKIEDIDKLSEGVYLTTLTNKIQLEFAGDSKELFEDITNAIVYRKEKRKLPDNINSVISKLRIMMAKISIDFFEGDLIIMDEFQRFKELLDLDDESEMGIIRNRLLNKEDVNILLLSATPYKLYQTLEETESIGDENHKEFLGLIKFLADKDKDLLRSFEERWDDFARSLKQIGQLGIEHILPKKEKAEAELYQLMCRTERSMVVKGKEDIIDTQKCKEPLIITEKDIQSFVEADTIVDTLKIYQPKVYMPIDYVKSSPYIFSFMDRYVLKNAIKDEIGKKQIQQELNKTETCLINKQLIKDFESIPYNNVRLQNVADEVFKQNAEFLLWIPPSLPYYELEGPYKGAEGFSKLLLFSAWEMVPRMISCLLSYEAEYKTVGKLVKTKKDVKDENKSYLLEDRKKRYPYPRLVLANKNVDGQAVPQRMSLFSLTYPSVTLMKLFNPIEVLNKKTERITKRELINSLASAISEVIEQHLAIYQCSRSKEKDTRWYWAAPVILDRKLNPKYTWEYFEKHGAETDMEIEEDIEKQGKGKQKQGNVYKSHFRLLEKAFGSPENLKLGSMPNDLAEILALQTLGSPAVAALRMLVSNQQEDIANALNHAQVIAETLVRKFNLPESIAAIEMWYQGRGDEDETEAYWRSVLTYCVDGNIQSMLDEYYHLIIDAEGLAYTEDAQKWQRVGEVFNEALKLSTASYKVDVKEEGGRYFRKPIEMRTHFSAAFANATISEQNKQRIENLRNAFNSPFRPFVLASTSIGQEGLDFHYYCRKIVHYNLPHNPIDIEQREGRINRFKGLVIRQNIAKKYGDITYSQDIWQELFEEARMREKGNESDLIPFWHIAPEENGYKIERIVPMYPLSADNVKYDRLMKLLNYYRITLGQPRQEELLEYLLQNVGENEVETLKELFVNLSPFYRKNIGK